MYDHNNVFASTKTLSILTASVKNLSRICAVGKTMVETETRKAISLISVYKVVPGQGSRMCPNSYQYVEYNHVHVHECHEYSTVQLVQMW